MCNNDDYLRDAGTLNHRCNRGECAYKPPYTGMHAQLTTAPLELTALEQLADQCTDTWPPNSPPQ